MKSLLLKMPFQIERVIEVDCPEVRLELEKKYGHYINVCSSNRIADIRIKKSSEYGYVVTLGETVTQTSLPLFCVESFLFEHPTYDEAVFALHGAAVEWKGKGYVFLAPTTTGKTTLTSYLTSCGCGYLTEDCVLLDRSSLEIYPFSMPLHLREGGVEVLKRHSALPENLQRFHENNGACRYSYTPSNCVERAVPLGEIFFIERTGDQNTVLPMTAVEKIAALMKAPIMVYPITPKYLQFLAGIAARHCKCLRYSNMNFVKEVIEQYATESFT